MAYKKGRFVIHYKDGTTYIEDRKNKNSWDERPRKPIKAIGIQPDPVIEISQIRTDPKTGEETKERVTIRLESTDPNVRYVMDEVVLKGSFKFDYGFFMDKFSDLKAFGKSRAESWGIRMGIVVDNLGHCYCLEYVGNGSPRGYYTTVHSLDMDQNSLINNYGINLEELPDPQDNFAPFPEINPLKLEERKKREQKTPTIVGKIEHVGKVS
jgi:hypothetical protein